MWLLVSGRRLAPRLRTAAASAFVAGVLGGALAACGGSGGTQVGEVTTADLHEVQDDLAVLEDRVGRLEVVEPAEGEMSDAEAAQLVGLEVSVTAEVSEVLTAGAVGVVVRLTGTSGPSLAVLVDTPVEELRVQDVVRVSGTARRIDRGSFEDDFGVAGALLFEDPHSFFRDAEGQLAIAGTRVDVVRGTADR